MTFYVLLCRKADSGKKMGSQVSGVKKSVKSWCQALKDENARFHHQFMLQLASPEETFRDGTSPLENLDCFTR